jgi:hypothetical protein
LRAIIAGGLGLVLLGLGAACSSTTPASFNLSNATVDTTHSCPPGASNKPYDLHATLDVYNSTSSKVIIEAVTADVTLKAVRGNWLEKVGDVYDAGSAAFGPGIIDAGSRATVRVTISSACTSGPASKVASSVTSYGDYVVTLHLVTTAGSFTISSRNRHRIAAA